VGLTALDVSHRLRGMIVSVAGGRDEAIRTLASSNTVAGLAATMISLPSGGEVRLDDLGVVTDTVAERSTFARDVVVGKQCRRGSTS
jgi:multidrug efflux pump subunit AcrB